MMLALLPSRAFTASIASSRSTSRTSSATAISAPSNQPQCSHRKPALFLQTSLPVQHHRGRLLYPLDPRRDKTLAIRGGIPRPEGRTSEGVGNPGPERRNGRNLNSHCVVCIPIIEKLPP